MQDDPQDKLLDILQTEGVIDLDIFDNLVDEMLIKHHDYTIDDIENMTNEDVLERVQEIFGMKLSEEDNKVYLLEYSNAFTA
jgi:thermostable 8-oxoguanine DNA glycosylase